MRWILATWEMLSPELIVKSFLVCELTNKPDGSDDSEVSCFTEGKPCSEKKMRDRNIEDFAEFEEAIDACGENCRMKPGDFIEVLRGVSTGDHTIKPRLDKV